MLRTIRRGRGPFHWILRAARMAFPFARDLLLRQGTIHRIVWLYRMPCVSMLLGKDDHESDVD